MGEHSPKHRAQEECYQKARRNARILQRFYDVYIDSRDGTLKKGRELTNGQINRSHKKDHENLHPFRGRKISKGRITARRSRNSLKTGSLVTFRDEILIVCKTHARKRQDKQTGKWVNSVNVEFKYPARGGRTQERTAEREACKRQMYTIPARIQHWLEEGVTLSTIQTERRARRWARVQRT